jgi:hypothetical protein
MTMRLIEGDVYDSAFTVARRDKLLKRRRIISASGPRTLLRNGDS